MICNPARIIWDDSKIRYFNPNIAQVKASRDEVMLLFGKRQGGHSDPNGICAKLNTRIILNPLAAKRFAVQLNKGIHDYELKFGSLDGKVITHKRLEPTPVMRPPRFRSAKGSQSVDLLFEFLKEQNISPAFERSFKVIDKKLFENRFLLGFEKDTISFDPDKKMVGISEKMGMPESFIEEFRQNLPESNIVGFGFGEEEMGCTVKAYLEFGDRFFRAIKSKPRNPDPYLSHLGFKWDAEDNTKKALTRYTCYPGYTSQEMITRLSKEFYAIKDNSPFEIVKGILDAASSKVNGLRFLFLEVREEDSHRASFDINVYGANLRLKELDPLISDIFRHYGLPQEKFQNVCGQMKNYVLGHIAGGTDRKGKDFLTIYSGE